MSQRKLRWIAVRVTVAMVLAISAWPATEKILYSFTGGNDGNGPYSSLVFDQKGNLYGTTTSGGAYSGGTVFELSPNSNGAWTETVLYSFGAYTGDGTLPNSAGPLVFDANGNLYGTTQVGGNSNSCPFHEGCGTVFELSPSPGRIWKETILHSFNDLADGAEPLGNVVFDNDGDSLYGTAVAGGDPSCGCGTIFRLSHRENGWAFTTLHTFSVSDGAFPFAGLSLSPSGLLWGTTNAGGAYTNGNVFKLQPDGKGYQSVFSFNYYDGGQPGLGPLVFGIDGHVLGTTSSGGCGPDAGIVFMLVQPVKHQYRLATLDCFGRATDGNEPYGGLFVEKPGYLYGTTFRGGGTQLVCDLGGCGTVFKLVSQKDQGWKETILYRFQGTPDAQYPIGGVVMDNSGNLYGTTWQGGTYGFGTVYEITP
jgi:uncharacterized repeat protein (TIGR03803 family)